MTTHLLVVILNDLSVLPDLLKHWQEIGVPATLLQSRGAYKTSSWLERVGLSMLGRAFETEEIEQRTLMSVIEDDELLERAIAEAERVVGGFDRPHSGLLFVLPVGRALGLKKRHRPSAEELIASPTLETALGELERIRCVPVSEVLAVHDLQPAIVQPEDTLLDVAHKMLDHTNVTLACVVNEEGRLVGIVRLLAIANDLFMQLMPEEFLHELSELEEAFEYAERFKHRRAADVMEEAVAVQANDTIRTAFARMHDHKLPGLPVVDETNHVIGYINLLEMLALVARGHPLRCKENSEA